MIDALPTHSKFNFKAKLVAKVTVVSTSFLLLFSGCAPSFDFSPAAEVEPVSLFSQTLDIAVTEASLTKLNPPGVNSNAVGATMNLFVGFDVINGADSFVSLRDLDYTVYLSGYQVDKGRLSSDQLGISQGSSQHFEFPINLNIQTNPELFNQSLQILNNATTYMRVRVEATTEDNLRQRLEDRLRVRALAKVVQPDINLVDIQLLNAQQILIKFQAENTGGVGYILNSQKLNLRQATRSVARADIFNIRVPAQTTIPFEVVFDLDTTFDAMGQIDISTDWLFDVLGAENGIIEDWFLRTKL